MPLNWKKFKFEKLCFSRNCHKAFEVILPFFVVIFIASKYQIPHWLVTKICTIKSPNFVTAHNFVTAADNFCEALLGFQL
jgi:hypothetical protein